MRIPRPTVAVLLFLALPLIGACATTGTPQGEDPTQMLVRIENDAVTSAGLTAWITSELGPPELLGYVPADDSAHFVYEPIGGAGQYWLIASRTGGPSYVSDYFTVVDDAVVSWEVTGDIVTVDEVEAPKERPEE